MTPSSTEPLFTEEDLAANQRRVLTDRQHQRLKRQERLYRFLIGFVAVSSITLAVVGVIVGNWIGAPFMLLMVALGVVEFALLYTLINRYRQHLLTDLVQGRVERYEGKMSHLPYRKRRADMTAITIGEKQFYVERASLRTFSEGSFYRVYVAPASSTMLSFERLD